MERAFATDSTSLERGYAILRRAVPAEAVDAALRRLHVDLVQRGLPADTLGSWLWSAHWFPHLRWDPAVVGLAWHLPEEFREGRMCDPQIILQPPDEDIDGAITPHVDQEPEWANGKRYRTIAGVALSPAHRANGALLVWPFGADEPEPVELDPGDVVIMHPQLPHSSGLNRSGSIRYAVYFRFLEADEAA